MQPAGWWPYMVETCSGLELNICWFKLSIWLCLTEFLIYPWSLYALLRSQALCDSGGGGGGGDGGGTGGAEGGSIGCCF